MLTPAALAASESILDVRRRIHRHHRISAAAQLDQTANLERAHNLIGDKDIADARVGHDFSLAQLGARDAHRPGLHLQPGDGRAFVALEMGPELAMPLGEKDSHVLKVGLQRIGIQQQGRRVNFGKGTQTGRCFGHNQEPRLCPTVWKSSSYRTS